MKQLPILLRLGHSAEKALVALVTSGEWDESGAIILALLDLSAA